MTYVAHVDRRARLGAGCREVGEGIWCKSSCRGSRVGSTASSAAAVSSTTIAATTSSIATTTTSITASISTTPSETTRRAAESTTTTAVASSSVSAAESATTSAEATSEAATAAIWCTARAAACVAVFTNFEDATLPVIAVELSDGVLRIIGVVERDDAGALGTPVGAEVDVCANDGTCLGWEEVSNCVVTSHGICFLTSLAEEILHVLPADSERKLDVSVKAVKRV